MVQQNANQFQVMMNAFAMYISNLQQKSVTLDIHKNFENSLKDYIATVTVKAPAIQGNKPMEIKISMEISRKELNQMLSFVNQKWKNIRPAKQAYKLLQCPIPTISETVPPAAAELSSTNTIRRAPTF